MEDSDTSSLSSALSSAPPSEDEKLAPIFLKARTNKVTKKPSSVPAAPVSPPRPPKSPSPLHEESFADNASIAFIVMFRSRFHAAFSPKLPHFGPQDLERGLLDEVPSPQVENILCALLGLVLNRKKPVERGHHGRALEEAITTQRSQWPRAWNGMNPLSGSRTFASLPPSDRLQLLHTLVIWSLSSSDTISAIIRDSYKQTRHEDDLNQPLSVQPWGTDGLKRRFWLIEGQDDTSFRLYREAGKPPEDTEWINRAGTIEEIREEATKLDKDGSQAARRLSTKITVAIPRFEASEEKRRRREYRQVRRAQFARPEPGFSMYEGRTRGKRMRYTFDDESEDIDDFTTRRSNRNSDRSTPAEGPVVTASGRQVRPRGGGNYGESLLSNQFTSADTPLTDDWDESERSEMGTRPRPERSSNRVDALNGSRKRKHIEGYNDVDRMSDEEDAASSAGWNSADNEDEREDARDDEEGDDRSDEVEESDLDQTSYSLIVKLKVPSFKNGQKDEPDSVATGAVRQVAKTPTVLDEKGQTGEKLPFNTASTEMFTKVTSNPVSSAHPSISNGTALPLALNEPHINGTLQAEQSLPRKPADPILSKSSDLLPKSRDFAHQDDTIRVNGTVQHPTIAAHQSNGWS